MIESCTDYGEGFTTSDVTQVCTGEMGTYSAAVCPSANRVGRCEISESNAAADAVSFYPPETAADVMSACSMENGVDGVTATFVPN